MSPRDAPMTAGNTPDEPRDGALARIIADRRRMAISIVVGLLLAAGVVLLIGRASGFAKLVDRLREADAGWLTAGVVVQIASIGSYILAFRAITKGPNGARLPLAPTSHIVLAGLGATRLLAAAGAAGLAVNYWGLRRAGIGTRESVTRVLKLNTLLYLVYGMLSLVTASIMLALGDAPVGLAVPWIVVVGTCVGAAAYVSAPGRAERLSRDPGANVSDNRVLATIRRGFATAVDGVVRLREILTHPRRYWQVITGCVGYWTFDIACLGIGLQAFDVSASVGVIILAYTTGYAASLLPLPTGGVGGVDAAMTFALNLLGVPLQDALAGVIAYRFIGFWLPTIPGVWALIRLPRLGRELTTSRG